MIKSEIHKKETKKQNMLIRVGAKFLFLVTIYGDQLEESKWN